MIHTVLITGATGGIGSAAARKFAKEGCNLVICCKKNVDGLMKLKTEIDSYRVVCEPFVKDVTQLDQISEMFDILSKKALIPDIIINNAGISHIGLLQDMSAEQWRNIIDVNLTSVFNCTKTAVPYMLSKKNGRIINVSSMWGCVGASCEAAYSASKGGINAFTKAMAKELAPSGISVNAVAFGAVDTSMNSFLSDEERQMLIDEIPAGRILSPKEAADILFTVSQFNPYVTGQIIMADGGMN